MLKIFDPPKYVIIYTHKYAFTNIHKNVSYTEKSNNSNFVCPSCHRLIYHEYNKLENCEEITSSHFEDTRSDYNKDDRMCPILSKVLLLVVYI